MYRPRFAVALHGLNIWQINDLTNFINSLLSRSEKLFLLRSNPKASDLPHLFFSSLSANHICPFSMQINAFGSSQSGKYSLFFFLHAGCLRSDWDDRCVNIWKIACKNLHKSAWFTDKNVFCHSISFHFYLCNHFQSPVFFSGIPARKAFDHSAPTAVLLTLSDPS